MSLLISDSEIKIRQLAKDKEDGYCVQADDSDQNNGVMKLDALADESEEMETRCLQKCSGYANATGCVMIWDNVFSRGCYAHTMPVAKGNGIPNHRCWIFSNSTGKCIISRRRV